MIVIPLALGISPAGVVPGFHHPVVVSKVVPVPVSVVVVFSVIVIDPAVVGVIVTVAIVVIAVVVEPGVAVVVVEAEAGQGDETVLGHQEPGGVGDEPAHPVFRQDKHPAADDDKVEMLIGVDPVVDGTPVDPQ